MSVTMQKTCDCCGDNPIDIGSVCFDCFILTAEERAAKRTERTEKPACVECDNPQALYSIAKWSASGSVTRHYCRRCYLMQP